MKKYFLGLALAFGLVGCGPAGQARLETARDVGCAAATYACELVDRVCDAPLPHEVEEEATSGGDAE